MEATDDAVLLRVPEEPEATVTPAARIALAQAASHVSFLLHPGRLATRSWRLRARARPLGEADVAGAKHLVEELTLGDDYVAEWASGIAREDAYAMARDVDRGMVHLHCIDGDEVRRVEDFRVPRADLERVVRVRLDADLVDRWDFLVLRDGRRYAVHTGTSNAGLFVGSDVHRLDRVGDCAPDPEAVAVAAPWLD